MKASLVVGAIVFAFVSVYYDWRFASGLLVGCVWGVGNLWALKRLVLAVLRPEGASIGDAALIGVVKFPVLYGLGFLALWSGWFSPISLVIGFSLILVVVLLKALGRMLVQSGKLERNGMAIGSRGGAK